MTGALHGDLATFDRISPAGFRILGALESAARALDLNLIITCGTEDHPADDPHTRGEAYDIRVRDLSVENMISVIHFLHEAFVPDAFTVLLETPIGFSDPRLVAIQYLNPQASGPHLHVQPKKGTVYPPVELRDA